MISKVACVWFPDLQKEIQIHFFVLFQRLAKNRKWSDSEQTLLLQCMLTGNAQEAFSTLSLIDRGYCLILKEAVCELVPEAYRHAKKI